METYLNAKQDKAKKILIAIQKGLDEAAITQQVNTGKADNINNL